MALGFVKLETKRRLLFKFCWKEKFLWRF